jgi:hypothetical protein
MRRTALRPGSRLTSRTELSPGKPIGRSKAEPGTRTANRGTGRKDTGFSPAVKLAIRTRAGGGNPDEAGAECCGIHLGRHGGEIQHIIARGSGGTSRPEISRVINGALMCLPHHAEAEKRLPKWYDRGFWRKNAETPGMVPLEMHGADGGVTRYLTPDGGYSEFPPAERGAA